jgi:hypothetical protein
MGLMTVGTSSGFDSSTSPQIRSQNTLTTSLSGSTKYNVYLETRGSTERNIHLYIPNTGGWDEGQITIEARRFSNESSGLKRNCIRMTNMPNRTQINTLGTVSRRSLYWDENSGYCFWE